MPHGPNNPDAQWSSTVKEPNIEISIERSESDGRSSEFTFGEKIKAIFPIFGDASVENTNKLQSNTTSNTKYEEIPFNLELAQDVCELLKIIKFDKFIILENFHYLQEEKQQAFAFDLRTFQEFKIRFVILGVWKEKNRLTQYNGDLDDRLKEISVEPWTDEDFNRVSEKGAKLLNIVIEKNALNKIIKSAFGSIGVFQELIKEYCLKSSVFKTQLIEQRLSDLRPLNSAITKKTNEYASRHERALNAIATGGKSYAPRQGQPPLYLPYYLVKAVLSLGLNGLEKGVDKTTLQEKIKKIHYRPDDVRPGDITSLLSTLANLQHKKGITPPLLDYNKEEKKLQVVDSTFFFYLRNADLEEFSQCLPEPFGNTEMTGDLFSGNE